MVRHAMYKINLSVLSGILALINQRKENFMCASCYAIENGIKFYSVVPSLLCDTHYFEWQNEKMYFELERSTEGLYL
jgi:hypothetical protein